MRSAAAGQKVSLAEGMLVSDRAESLIRLDDSLTALTALDERKGRVVEMRCFGGLTIEETAEALNVSTETVKRDWRLAKAWLQRELRK
jgi:RNA polymerase sigma-70 factor (ECF subfamily)